MTDVADLADLAEAYLSSRVEQRTLDPMSARNHRSTLRGFIQCVEEVPLEALSRTDVERWMATRGHLKPASRRANHSAVKTFCAWLVKEGHLTANPVLDVPAPKVPRTVPRALPRDAISDLIEACPDARGRAIVSLMVGMGLRCVEVSRMELERWDQRTNVMTVRGKGSHERVLPVPQEVTDAVNGYLDEYPAASGPLIRSYKRPQAALSADALSGMVSEWLRAAAVKRLARDGVSAHALRATAASDVLDQCNDLRIVQELLGHEHLATTSIYLRRSSLKQMRSAMEGRDYRRHGGPGNAA